MLLADMLSLILTADKAACRLPPTTTARLAATFAVASASILSVLDNEKERAKTLGQPFYWWSLAPALLQPLPHLEVCCSENGNRNSNSQLTSDYFSRTTPTNW